MVQYMDKNSGFNMWNANKNATQKKSPLSGFFWWLFIFIVAWWAIGAIMNPKAPVQETTDAQIVEDISSVPVINIQSDKINANVQGLRVSDVKLTDFAKSTDTTEPVVLLGTDDNFIEAGLLTTGTTAPVAKTVWTQQDDGSYVWNNSDKVKFVRDIKTDGYLITITDTVQNNSGKDIAVAPYVRIVKNNDMKSASGVSTGAISYVNSDVEDLTWAQLDKKSYAYSTQTGFTGFADQYWETVASMDAPDQTIRVKKSGDKYTTDTAAAAKPIHAGESKTFTTTIFAGPRDQTILNSIDSKIAGIAETINYGWFWFLARPMLWVLNGINHVVMNYGVAIIIMTILLRLMMWPLTRKSYASMAAMQKMQPEMQRIQKLYANDKMRLQMEMMKLYQTHKTSPMSGCLPMLIQIPIFFALYKALLVSVQMRNAHFLWISDLSAMDPYFILPILMGLTMWLQQYLQSANKKASANDIVAQTQKMMNWMPLLFTIMFAWMPAGLVLYWTISNVFGIIQMQLIKKQSK